MMDPRVPRSDEERSRSCACRFAGGGIKQAEPVDWLGEICCMIETRAANRSQVVNTWQTFRFFPITHRIMFAMSCTWPGSVFVFASRRSQSSGSGKVLGFFLSFAGVPSFPVTVISSAFWLTGSDSPAMLFPRSNLGRMCIFVGPLDPVYPLGDVQVRNQKSSAPQKCGHLKLTPLAVTARPLLLPNATDRPLLRAFQ